MCVCVWYLLLLCVPWERIQTRGVVGVAIHRGCYPRSEQRVPASCVHQLGEMVCDVPVATPRWADSSASFISQTSRYLLFALPLHLRPIRRERRAGGVFWVFAVRGNGVKEKSCCRNTKIGRIPFVVCFKLARRV